MLESGLCLRHRMRSPLCSQRAIVPEFFEPIRVIVCGQAITCDSRRLCRCARSDGSRHGLQVASVRMCECKSEWSLIARDPRLPGYSGCPRRFRAWMLPCCGEIGDKNLACPRQRTECSVACTRSASRAKSVCLRWSERGSVPSDRVSVTGHALIVYLACLERNWCRSWSRPLHS